MNGRSLYRYEGQWFEHDLAEVESSDHALTFALDVEDGDCVNVTAKSADGHRYRGEYRYREGSNSNGEVQFDRHRGLRGEVFVGEWLEAGGPRGPWVILLEQKD